MASRWHTVDNAMRQIQEQAYYYRSYISGVNVRAAGVTVRKRHHLTIRSTARGKAVRFLDRLLDRKHREGRLGKLVAPHVDNADATAVESDARVAQETLRNYVGIYRTRHQCTFAACFSGRGRRFRARRGSGPRWRPSCRRRCRPAWRSRCRQPPRRRGG